MEIYLDNAATTAVYPEVAALMSTIMCGDFGNPSSLHKKGIEAEQYLRTAAKELADILKVKEKNIYFTSGGTEGDNWALIGAANANKRQGMHIITTQIEHAAVSEPIKKLEQAGFEVTRLGVDETGTIRLSELENAIRKDTILVSIMAVNNEIGAIQPIKDAGAIIKHKNPGTLFHVDAIQAFCKIPVYPVKDKIDLMAVSSHKIHGPKGAGFLYIAPSVKIEPLIVGGGQQGGYRSGTDNVPGAAGMALAARMMADHLEENAGKMNALRSRLIRALTEMPDVVVHGQSEPFGAPHIVNASFIGIRSEVLLHSLEEKGIYVSSGSACSSHKRAASATLTAIGCSREEIESSVRFSFCEKTTEEEIDQTVRSLQELLPVLRKYSRR